MTTIKKCMKWYLVYCAYYYMVIGIISSIAMSVWGWRMLHPKAQNEEEEA